MRFKDLFYEYGHQREWFTVSIIILIVLSFFASVGFVVNIGMKIQCNDQAEIMDINYSYGFFPGCMFEIDGKWIPYDNYYLTKTEIIKEVIE